MDKSILGTSIQWYVRGTQHILPQCNEFFDKTPSIGLTPVCQSTKLHIIWTNI